MLFSLLTSTTENSAHLDFGPPSTATPDDNNCTTPLCTGQSSALCTHLPRLTFTHIWQCRIGHVHDTEKVCPQLFHQEFGPEIGNITPMRQVRARNMYMSYPHSSRSPGHPTPALFTRTSILLHTLAASSTRCLIASVPESTSSSRRCKLGDCGRSSILWIDRAVAITRSPRSRTSDTKRRPKPVDVPKGSSLYCYPWMLMCW
jgi:hypothetical protein